MNITAKRFPSALDGRPLVELRLMADERTTYVDAEMGRWTQSGGHPAHEDVVLGQTLWAAAEIIRVSLQLEHEQVDIEGMNGGLLVEAAIFDAHEAAIADLYGQAIRVEVV